jgi:hypothetical protein
VLACYSVIVVSSFVICHEFKTHEAQVGIDSDMNSHDSLEMNGLNAATIANSLA